MKTSTEKLELLTAELRNQIDFLEIQIENLNNEIEGMKKDLKHSSKGFSKIYGFRKGYLAGYIRQKEYLESVLKHYEKFDF